ncbi:hypothetical protein DOC35_19415 [Salmonella enterica subsp. enterica]|nr:hypothetical protein [Salmonella enterica subsp. enterica]
MYISLWVLIPALIVVILGARESWQNIEKLTAAQAKAEDDRHTRDELRAELARERAYTERAAIALNHLQDSAWLGDSDGNQLSTAKMQDLTRQALKYYYDEGKGAEDAPWNV